MTASDKATSLLPWCGWGRYVGVFGPRVISALLDLGSSIVNNGITLGGSKEITNITI